MFAQDKTLPPPPTVARPRNESLGAALPTYRSRPGNTPNNNNNSPNVLADGFSFSSVRNLFENAKKGAESAQILMRNPLVQKTATAVARNEQLRGAAISAASNPHIQQAAFNAFTQQHQQQQQNYTQKTPDAKNDMLYPELSALDPFEFPPQLSSKTTTAKTTNSYERRRHEERLMWNRSAIPTTTETDISISSSSSNNVRRGGPSSSTTCDDLASIFSNSCYKKLAPARPPPPKFQAQQYHSNPNLCSMSANNELDDIFKPITYTKLNNTIKSGYANTSNIKNNNTSPPLDPYSTSQPHAIVKYPYKAANPDELSCYANDAVLLKKEVDDEWIYATNTRSGSSGIVPLSFLDIQVPLLLSTNSLHAQSHFDNNINNGSNISSSVICWVRALYDYETGVDGDLQFKRDDIIAVKARVNEDWLRGETSQKHSGIFPANYVSFESGSLNQLPMESVKDSATVSVIAQLETVIAEFDYCSGVAEDLEFKSGDVIEIVSKTQSADWIMGKLGQKTGLVPLTYVRKN